MGLLNSFIKKKVYFVPRGMTPKERASVLLDDAHWHAEEINSSTDVFDFVYSYTKLSEIIDELIWLNEKKKVFMAPTPRRNWDKIQQNMTNTINNFIDRGISKLSLQPKTRENDIKDFFDSIKSDKVLCSLLSCDNKKKMSAIENEIQAKNEKEEKRRLIEKIGQAPLDFRCFDLEPFVLIDAIEKQFSSFYRAYLKNALSPEKGRQIYSELKDNLKKSTLPLMAEIRTDELLEEYEQKFSSASILFAVDNMSGADFELWCSGLLKKDGFTDVEITPASRDQGVDIIACKDGLKYAIQCKCYSHDLGNSPVQEVNAGKMFYRCHIGVVMTNRYFTQGAKAAAEATCTLLWDRDKIFQMYNANLKD